LWRRKQKKNICHCGFFFVGRDARRNGAAGIMFNRLSAALIAATDHKIYKINNMRLGWDRGPRRREGHAPTPATDRRDLRDFPQAGPFPISSSGRATRGTPKTKPASLAAMRSTCLTPNARGGCWRRLAALQRPSKRVIEVRNGAPSVRRAVILMGRRCRGGKKGAVRPLREHSARFPAKSH